MSHDVKVIFIEEDSTATSLTDYVLDAFASDFSRDLVARMVTAPRSTFREIAAAQITLSENRDASYLEAEALGEALAEQLTLLFAALERARESELREDGGDCSPRVPAVPADTSTGGVSLVRWSEYQELDQGLVRRHPDENSDRSARAALAADGVAADLLEQMGAAGREGAAVLRERTAARFREWTNARRADGLKLGDELGLWAPRWLDLGGGCLSVPIVGVIAYALWVDRIRDSISRPTRTPALSLVVVERFIDVLHLPSRSVIDGRVVTPTGQVLARAELSVNVDDIEFEDIVLCRGGYYGAMLLREVVHAVWQRHQAGEAPYDQLVYPGGFSGLAEQLRFTSKQAASKLRDIVRSFQRLVIVGERAEIGGLWTYSMRKHGRRDELVIKVAEPLCPGFEQTFGRGRKERKLVPYPRRSPPLVGRHNDWAANLALQNRVLVQMRLRAEELADQHAVRITAVEWERMAIDSSLPTSLIHAIQSRWVEGDAGTGRDDPPFLTRPDNDWWGLAPAYAGELAMLLEAARLTRVGRERRRRRGRR